MEQDVKLFSAGDSIVLDVTQYQDFKYALRFTAIKDCYVADFDGIVLTDTMHTSPLDDTFEQYGLVADPLYLENADLNQGQHEKILEVWLDTTLEITDSQNKSLHILINIV
jgi:hypothetical protein